MKNLILALTLFSTALFTAVNANANLMLSFSDADINVGLNETFTVDLYVDTQSPVNAILSWGLDVDFDTNVLALNNFTLSNNFIAMPISDDGIAGSAALPIGVSGNNVLLGTFEFTAIAVGDVSLTTSTTPLDLFEGFTTTNFFNPPAHVHAASNVSVISEPSMLAMFSLAALALVRVRRTS